VKAGIFHITLVMKKILNNNSLSIVIFLLFLFSIIGQAITGLKQYNEEMIEKNGITVTMDAYLTSGHFLQTTFENWESEFLQMALFVILSMFLFQKGSAESKDPDNEEEVDREPDPKKKDAPWAVKKGGWILDIYRHSLCYTLTILFALSFLLHWYGSLKDYNLQQQLDNKPTATEYLSNSRFWFESFQNWESEFISLFSIIILSIFLREQGSPQSKPVDAAHSETGG
jgi:hypothetical protein